MVSFKHTAMSTLSFQFQYLVSAESICKASPSSGWPSDSQWAALNISVSGHLLKPPPPGAVCHPDQPMYNAAECPALLNNWTTLPFHTEQPVSSAWDNWNNDSCLPTLPSPCSGEGYPVYVINATCKEDIKAGIDFARENNIRLNVKSTGHDYLGRSTSPNSLSIWTHHLRASSVSQSFQPQGCPHSLNVSAVTSESGGQMGELNLLAHQQGLYILSGGSSSVGVVGYLAGGGHAALTPTFGLGADNALEVEIVTPSGEFLTLNECQNQDLFWAVRGGGGFTFGVVTNITIRAWPEFNFLTIIVTLETNSGNPSFYPALSYMFSQFPHLSSLGIGSYNLLSANVSNNGSSNSALFSGVFMLPALSPENTTASLAVALSPIINNITSTYPDQFLITPMNVTTWPTFYDWWYPGNGPIYPGQGPVDYAGMEFLVGSRLIGADALYSREAVETALKGAAPEDVEGTGLKFYILGGKGTANAIPRGGSDAVNPAWRKAIVHAITGTTWTPLNNTEKVQNTAYLTNVTLQYLRDLDPDSGAYINEANPYEPNWQQAFWGSNYERLVEIKKSVDPEDIFWCHPCVGNEGWETIGDRLCRV